MALRTILFFLKSLKIHGSQHVTSKVRGIFPRLSYTNIDGSKGGRDTCLPLGPISFLFMQFSNILPNNRFLLQTQQLAPPRKSWIRHCSETACEKFTSTSTVTEFLHRVAKSRGICARIWHFHKHTKIGNNTIFVFQYVCSFFHYLL